MFKIHAVSFFLHAIIRKYEFTLKVGTYITMKKQIITGTTMVYAMINTIEISRENGESIYHIL